MFSLVAKAWARNPRRASFTKTAIAFRNHALLQRPFEVTSCAAAAWHYSVRKHLKKSTCIRSVLPLRCAAEAIQVFTDVSTTSVMRTLRVTIPPGLSTRAKLSEGDLRKSCRPESILKEVVVGDQFTRTSLKPSEKFFWIKKPRQARTPLKKSVFHRQPTPVSENVAPNPVGPVTIFAYWKREPYLPEPGAALTTISPEPGVLRVCAFSVHRARGIFLAGTISAMS